FHVMREYQVEPMEAMFVREVMQSDTLTVGPDQPVAGLIAKLLASADGRRQRLYPVTGGDGVLLGVIVPSDLLAANGVSGYGATDDGTGDGTGGDGTGGDGVKQLLAGDIARSDALVAYPDEILRAAADRMAEHWVGALPVVTRDQRRLLGVLTEFDLLKARQRQLQEERQRERVLRLRRTSASAAPKPVSRETAAPKASPGSTSPSPAARGGGGGRTTPLS
ncbi:MAG: CBS domain-containing protein, partial [Trebonia sp.]